VGWLELNVRRSAISGVWVSGRVGWDSGSFLASSSCWLVRDSNVHLQCRFHLASTPDSSSACCCRSSFDLLGRSCAASQYRHLVPLVLDCDSVLWRASIRDPSLMSPRRWAGVIVRCSACSCAWKSASRGQSNHPSHYPLRRVSVKEI
jgi:hypothetical protein